MSLPVFRYHPDPLATGSIEVSSARCDCCGLSRGFVYTASFYTAHKAEPKLCPWCIADGRAAVKYDGQFSDDRPLRHAGLDEEIVGIVCRRTPGYISWQQEIWQSHCADACEFHGDVEPAELRVLSGDALAEILRETQMSQSDWRHFTAGYQKGGNPSAYKFICRHCHIGIYTLDYT